MRKPSNWIPFGVVVVAFCIALLAVSLLGSSAKEPVPGSAVTLDDLELGEYFVLARVPAPLNAGPAYGHHFLLTKSPFEELDPVFVKLTKSDFPDLSDLHDYTTIWGLHEVMKLDNLLNSELISLSTEEMSEILNQKYKFVRSIVVVVEDGKRHVVPRYGTWPPR